MDRAAALLVLVLAWGLRVEADGLDDKVQVQGDRVPLYADKSGTFSQPKVLRRMLCHALLSPNFNLFNKILFVYV